MFIQPPIEEHPELSLAITLSKDNTPSQRPHHRHHRLHESIAKDVVERETPSALPFYTNFNVGVGHKIFDEGRVRIRSLTLYTTSLTLAVSLLSIGDCIPRLE